MKKLFLLGAFVATIFSAQAGFSQCAAPCAQPCEQPCNDQPVGDCYCKYVRYEACPYTIPRCVEEQIPYTRRCCRYVPQYYQVQKCRYVPEYYSVTCCRQVPEYFDVCETKTCKKIIQEPACRYVPRYYWKHECQAPAAAPCAPCGQ